MCRNWHFSLLSWNLWLWQFSVKNLRKGSQVVMKSTITQLVFVALVIGERESGRMLYSIFRLISVTVNIRVSWEEEVGLDWRWQIESLVTCVPRHLLIVVASPIIGRPTMEARGTIVHSATNHSAKMVIWRPTSSFTLGGNRTSAHNATFQPIRFPA